jgi:transposase
MAPGAIRDAAIELLRAEQIRAVPIRYQTSIYTALEHAARLCQQVLAEHARKGGNAKKTDTLQMLIQALVERDPSITVRKLEERLKAYQGIEIIEDIGSPTIAAFPRKPNCLV